jgi:hypothetical protein
MLKINFQITSWICTGLAWTNCVIVTWDGCTGRLATQYRIVTFVVALLFGVIGGIVFGVERSLGKIRRCSVKTAEAQEGRNLIAAWRQLYVLLAVGVLLVLLAMGSGLIAIIGRLHQGLTLFG